MYALAFSKIQALASAAFDCSLWKIYEVNWDAVKNDVSARSVLNFGIDEVSQEAASHVAGGSSALCVTGKVNETTADPVQNRFHTDDPVPGVPGGCLNIIDPVEVTAG
jgi:hypothetical protein